MPARAQHATGPGPADAADKKLRSHFDLLSKQVADLELTYRDLGIKFFVLPVHDRARYLGEDLEDAKKLFLLQSSAEAPKPAALLTSARAMLEEVRLHLHRLKRNRIHDEEFGAAEKLRKAYRMHDRASAWIHPFIDKMRGVHLHGRRGTAQTTLNAALWLAGGGLPVSEDDERWAAFRAWALTVREVQNLIALGESETEAIAMLKVEMVTREERIVASAREIEAAFDADDEMSDDDYFSDSDEERSDDDASSSPSNPWEDV